jgi:DNA end-binding protein Ku
MSRPIWSGVISFGLVSVPVSLHAAENSTDLRFNLIDSRDKARIRYERVNEVTGEEVPWSAIVKGYEYGDGNYVLLKDEDFRKAAVEATRIVEIETFVNPDDIGALYFDKPYFLVPGKGGDKGYALLREAMDRAGKFGIAKVVIRSRQHLAALIPWNNALVLNLMRFSQELRDPSEFPIPKPGQKSVRVTPKEVELAIQLINSMSAKWDPTEYVDDYRKSLMAWIRKKAKTGKVEPVAEEPEEKHQTAKVVDVMQLLRDSLTDKKGLGKHGAGGKKSKARVETIAPAKKKPVSRGRKTRKAASGT